MRKDPTEFRERFAAWKAGEKVYENGLPAYGGGKSAKKGPYVKGVVSKPVYDEFDAFLQTLPDNQRALGAYNTRRYWELNGKPRDFAEAIGKGMYTVQNDNGTLNWHAGSIVYNENTDKYEFMKPNYHPTRWMEQVYGYDQSPEFQKDWKVQYNGPMLSDRYVRREKPGLKIKGGQLPMFAMGTDKDVDMGPKKQTTSETIEKVRKTAPHEQPLSGTDPIGEFYVRTVAGMKAAQLLGKYLTKLRLNRMADTYRNVRKYDSDVENYTGRNLRPQNIRFADEAAREQFLSRPSNPISTIGDFLAQGYTKLQGHPVIGPLIPF